MYSTTFIDNTGDDGCFLLKGKSNKSMQIGVLELAASQIQSNQIWGKTSSKIATCQIEKIC
jgi:hypothetical protein